MYSYPQRTRQKSTKQGWFIRKVYPYNTTYGSVSEAGEFGLRQLIQFVECHLILISNIDISLILNVAPEFYYNGGSNL